MPHVYELHWTCHACGEEIGESDAVVIDKGFIYHVRHDPVMILVFGTEEREEETNYEW